MRKPTIAEGTSMSEAERLGDADVIDMGDYMEESLRTFDTAIADLTQQRRELAVRIAVIRGATSPAVRAEVEEFDRRAAAGTPYTGEDARDVLGEAHKRFGS